jgi:fluoride exporter
VLPLLVAIGGAIGVSARWSIDLLSGAEVGTIPALATLGINVMGCFLIGILSGFLADDQRWRAFLGVGLLGGFTTFSGFAADTVLLAREGRFALAFAYIAATVITCLVAASVGAFASSTIRRAR